MGSKEVIRYRYSPSVSQKTIRKIKLTPVSKSESNDAPAPLSSRNLTVRKLFINIGNNNNRKKNPKETTKKEYEAGPSTQADSHNPQNKIDVIRTIWTEKDEGKYFMQHRKRGKAIILNHENFDKDDKINDTGKDVEKLKEVLSKLKFEVEVHTDLKYIDIFYLLKELSAADYRDSDCIMFFILTHGNKRGEISAKDVYYPVEKLWENFTSDKCSSLAGKPKLFFVNAYRGGTSQKMQSYSIPKHADFLIAFSTVQGFKSYRDPTQGSWFIQSLCEVLNEHYETKDLLKMLTITTRKLALDYKTVADKKEDCELQHVPSITSMLMRDVYFHS